MTGDLRLDQASAGTLPALKALPPPDAVVREIAGARVPPTLNSSVAGPSADLPNPRLHTDLALNRLVLEFFDAQGTLTNSIPSQKQLDAYRLAAFAGKPQSPNAID